MVNLPGENEIIAGKYRVERIIGRVGMGIVVAAWHLELDQRVALKFLMPELAERGESAERFRREARAAARIKSEHVVRVLDVGNWEGNAPYMVMEYLDGRDLSAELEERGTLAIRECVDYLLQAIEAVAEAHALGIVHRDLKPENLFLARRVDGSRSVKVLDFGISKTIVLGSSDERSLTRTANIMGSPFYMSPEQMRTPRDVDARSDIWALGAILYDLLTGRPPYVAETIPQLCTMLLESDPKPLLELRPDADPELGRVVARCLAKDTAARWGSVVDLAYALLPFGSRSSKIHVERAGRVLATSGVRVPPESSIHSSEPPRPLNAPQAATNVGLGRATPTQSSVSPGQETPDSSTQDSWGKTQKPRPPSDKATSAHRTRTQLTIGGALLLVAAGVVVALHSTSRPEAGNDDPGKSPSGDNAPGLRPREPLAVPAASIEVPGSLAEVPAADPSAAAASAPAAGAGEKTDATRPVDSALSSDNAAKKLAPRPPPVRPKPGPSSGLTDFGGRR